MTAVLPDSDQLRARLGDPAVRREIRAKPHPWLLRRMLIVRSSSVAGDRLVGELVEYFGECWWERGRWRVRRAQLRLPGF